MKKKLMIFPTPLAGLGLAIVSLGWAWENVSEFGGVVQNIGAVIGGIILLIIALKFMFHLHELRSDLQHPVVGSVVPTFAMGLMALSNAIGQYSLIVGDVIWCLAVIIHLVFLASFVYHRFSEFSIHHMVPSWFVPPIGLIVADVAFLGTPALRPLADFVLWFGLVSYAILLPLMLYRLIFVDEIPDAAKPTIAIMAAPASLSLAGYLSITETPSFLIVSVLLGIAVLMTALIYVSFYRLLRLPFSPAYAAFTFPMVIGATALFKVANWVTEIGLPPHYQDQLILLASIELFIATAVVVYVAFGYQRFLIAQWKTVHSAY